MQRRKLSFHPRLLALTSLSLLLLVTIAATVQAQESQVGVVNRNANLRAGPSTLYAVVGSAPAGTTVRIAGQNAAGDWYQLSSGRWIAAFLVDRNGAGAARPAPANKPAALPRWPPPPQLAQPLLPPQPHPLRRRAATTILCCGKNGCGMYMKTAAGSTAIRCTAATTANWW